VVYHLESKTPGRFIKDEDNSKLFNDLWLDQIIPDDSKYYQEDGILMEWLGNETEQRWLILHDANENSFWQKAVKYKEQELFQEAIKHYKKAIKFNPFDPRHLTITEELAELHESLGNYLEAANCYEYLKKIEPSPHHYFKLGLLHKKMNNFTEAIEYLEKAKELLTGSVSNNELAPDVTNWAPEAMII
jgi:tetratricopeptide (TPR) repeat protein